MDKDKLEAILSKYYEWVYPNVSQDSSLEKLIPTKPGSKEYKQTYTPNPQLGPRIIRLRNDTNLSACNWCGKIVNQKQNITRITDAKTKCRQWHQSCYNCSRVWDNETQQLKPLSKSLETRRKKK